MDLFNRATREEQEILTKILLGELRIGLHDGLLQEAVVKAAGAGLDVVRRAAMFPQYSSGFALRFARITRIREDRGPDQITTLADLRAHYERQFGEKGRARR